LLVSLERRQKMFPETELQTSQAEEVKEDKKVQGPTPEQLASYRIRRPEQFAFTPEWKRLVQARATYELLNETGFLH
jgi:hypothetical protein